MFKYKSFFINLYNELSKTNVTGLLKYFIAILFVLMAYASARAQGSVDPYDIALNKYQQICDKVVGLNDKALSGNKIPENEIKSLMNQLSELRGTLSAATGAMTEEQQVRFRFIRDRFSVGKKGQEFIYLSNVKQPIREHARTLSLDSLYCSSSKFHRFICKKPYFPNHDYGILASVGVVPSFSYGLTGIVLWRKFGIYANVRSSLTSLSTSYDCMCDGTTSNGYIWTSGRSKTSRLNVSTGAIWNAISWLHPFIGVGYGSKQLAWEDSSGEWAKVTDKSYSGLSIDYGVLFSYKRLLFSIGGSSISTKYSDLVFGVGIKF
jgi:hypothetical protein